MPIPRTGDVELRRVRLGGTGNIASRVVVIEHADVDAPVVVECILVAAVQVPFQAASVIADARVMKPADVGAPCAKVKAAGMSEIEATLKRGLAIGLGQAAENVLAIDAEVAGDRIRLGRFGGLGRFGIGWRGRLCLSARNADRGQKNKECGECTDFEAHEKLPLADCKESCMFMSAQAVPSSKFINFQ